MESTYRVDGMTCGGCAAAITNALERIGVAAEVSLKDKSVRVRGNVGELEIRAAVETAGFSLGERVG